MAVVATGMVAAILFHFVAHPSQGDEAPAHTRSVLLAVLAIAMTYYGYLGFRRSFDREPQLVIDSDGILLGFGRNRRFAWRDVEWVRLRRLAFRPQLQIALTPDAFVAANLALSMWNLDDGLRPVRGTPAAVLVRDNGLDTSARAMLDAVRAFRPNLVKT
ncbi:hypothetical protein [Reyranella sp.]|jgi:hypothetical protein|uniref:hypothetical protein n=1 Tax=Reyranella sp. TaxID=1929291 RepID=UPI002F94EDAB